MNSAKVTSKKTNKSPEARTAAELSAAATPPPKNGPLNSTIDGKRALALKPITPVSRPAHIAAKASTSAARVTDAATPSSPSFAALSAAPAAPVAKAAAVQNKQAGGARVAVSSARTTTIEAKIDVGFGNTVYLRGEGPGLSWDRGVPCECVNRNTWRWTAPRAEKLTFKLLLNDSVWAKGADVVIGAGEKVEVVPAF